MSGIFAIVFVGLTAIVVGVVLGLVFSKGNKGLDRTLREELTNARREQAEAARLGREELQKSILDLGKLLGSSVKDAGENQTKANSIFGDTLKSSLGENASKIEKLTSAQQTSMEQLRVAVTQSLTKIQEDNEQKLEKIRQTVDEKLQTTLEKRLGESFKLVSDRLESVQKGLGEMQTLASGVGDLKKVLTNVKTRGIWGEILLGNLLEQILSPEQYASNVATTNTSERVEFAIKLPGRKEDSSPTWIPIDSKFPKEDYERLINAQEAGDPLAAAEAIKALEMSVRKFAQDISEKYIAPPHTTDFGIMFLPSEGLYAEIIRRTETMELLQRKYHVVVTGPTTLAALLNSLQMGFKTLAIEKRSSEVWETLGAVKTEFEKYADLMGKVKKKLDEASNTIEDVGKRTRVITSKLRGVERLEEIQTQKLLPIEIAPEIVEEA